MEANASAKRPVYLVIALLAMWLTGMNAAAEGWLAIEVVRNPLVGAAPSVAQLDLDDVVRSALVAAISEHARVTFPVGVAELILGGLLVLVAAKALFGRRASRSFALQVIAANAMVLVVGYALRQPVRERVVSAVVHSGLEQQPAGIKPEDFRAVLHAKWWWTFRLHLGLQLAALAFSAVALSRRSARELLEPDGNEPSTEEEG